MGWARNIRAVGLSCVFLAGAIITGCGIDDVGPRSRMVGGRCTVTGDCVQRCVTGNEFPGGYCTVGCVGNDDCPGGSICVASNGGVCMATCQVDRDCDPYGAGYACGPLQGQSSGAEARACIGR